MKIIRVYHFQLWQLKQFTKGLVLAVLKLDKKMRIEVDILNYAIREYYL